MTHSEADAAIAEIEEQVRVGLLRRSEGNRLILAVIKAIDQIEKEERKIA